LKNAGYILDAGIISAALIYLNNSLTNAFFAEVADFIPNLLSAALVGVLGIIAIRLLTKATENFLKTIGTTSYLREIGFSGSAVKVIASLLKGFLYLVLLQLALAQLGIGNTFVRELVNASSWAAAFWVASLLFLGLRICSRTLQQESTSKTHVSSDQEKKSIWRGRNRNTRHLTFQHKPKH